MKERNCLDCSNRELRKQLTEKDKQIEELKEKLRFTQECEKSATEVYNSNLSYLYKTECEAIAILNALQDFIYTTDIRRADELAFLQNRIEMFLEEHKV